MGAVPRAVPMADGIYPFRALVGALREIGSVRAWVVNALIKLVSEVHKKLS